MQEELNIGNIDRDQAEKIIKCLDALKDMCESRDKLNSQEFIMTHTKIEIDKEHAELLKKMNDFVNNFRAINKEYKEVVFLKCLSIIVS